MKFLTIRLSMWAGPRYSTGRGRSYRSFNRLPDAREYAIGKGYKGIKVVPLGGAS